MARRTLSGAPSSKSDRCTCTRPSRNRMVVFRLVKRRKRTSREGIGARGRRARYSSANSKCNSEFTAFSVAGLGLGENRVAQKERHRRYLVSDFWAAFSAAFSSFFFSAKYFSSSAIICTAASCTLWLDSTAVLRTKSYWLLGGGSLSTVVHRALFSTTSLSSLRRSSC